MSENVSIPSYPKVYNLGHAAITDLFEDPVVVQEKVDGSQFSFGILDGALLMRSKGAVVYDSRQGGALGEGSGMFKPAVGYIESRWAELVPNVVYRAEFLGKPKHNTLKYDRIPSNGLVLFDLERWPDHVFLGRNFLEAEATNLGIDVIPSYTVDVKSAEQVEALLEQDSYLGGCKIEGVVFKNHHRYGRDGKFLAGKYVSPAFKEVHGKEWKKSNPSGKDIRDELGSRLCAEGRWAKGVQRLRDSGELTGSPQDIGPLLKSISQDIKEEEEEAIKDALFKWAWPSISRAAIRGFPEWYKARLMEEQFNGEDS
jgi:hypothetical protein